MTAAPASTHVEIITDGTWSVDVVREGAAEFAILMRLAKLQQHPGSVGIVGTGDRHGVFRDATHRVLELAVRNGIPVVRLSRQGSRNVVAPDSLFIDGRGHSPESAAAVLHRCLERFGPLPVSPAENYGRSVPTLAELRDTLDRYQAEFDREPQTS